MARSRMERVSKALNSESKRQRSPRNAYGHGPNQWESTVSGLAQPGSISGAAILPLRLFLGLTFLYAGLQKIADPGFFRSGSSTYIGTQLLGFSRGSPIHFLMTPMLEHAVAFGALTIATEIMVGVLVLLGLLTRPAALVGLIVNLVLFLSATWHVYPYFLGSDIVFVMAWLTLAIAGPGALCLDTLLGGYMASRLPAAVQRLLLGPIPALPERWPKTIEGEDDGSVAAIAPRSRVWSRAEVIFGGLGAVGLAVLGILPRAAASGQLAGQRRAIASRTPSSGSAAAIPAGAKKVGNISQLPPNTAGTLADPKSGDPAVVVRLSGSQLYAYDAVCTHAGCTVGFDAQSKLLVCPCHGAAYDPAHGAQVVGGPAPSPLASLPIAVDHNGDIYLV